MSTKPIDARLRELQFLSKLAAAGEFRVEHPLSGADKLMFAHLLEGGYLNGVATLRWEQGMPPGLIEAELRDERRLDLHRLFIGQALALKVTHKGLVRASELQQALQTGRDREPFGILLGQRHVTPDLIIAVASTSQTSPLSVAYLDANGFKAINDTLGHGAGDEALKSYMSVVSMLTEAVGEAYRAGGDEVVVIMPATTSDIALKSIRAIATQLHKEKMPGDFSLSVSCGIVTTTDAGTDAADMLKAADLEQKRAKERSRVGSPRPSVIAVEGRELEVIPWR